MIEKKILIVDDDEDIAEFISYNLSQNGFNVKSFTEPLDALAYTKKWIPQLILLDMMMPKLDGLNFCKQVRMREELNDCFVVFLTARDDEYSQVQAFESGSDAYITKPIRPRALVSRINAIFSRQINQSNNPRYIDYKDIRVDKANYSVILKDEVIKLPKKEFELLYFFMSHPDVIKQRDEILRIVWGEDVYVNNRTIDVHIRKIREKIGDTFIHTIKGVGYKFSIQEPSAIYPS